MRKWILVLFPLVLAGSAWAQGIVSFNTSSASGRGIKYYFGGTNVNVPVGNPASIPGYGTLNIASYAASAGTVLNVDASGVPIFDSNWHISSGIGHQIAPFPGSVPTFTMTTDASLGAGGPGVNVQFIIVGWTGAFTDFNSVYTAASGGQPVTIAWSGSQFSTGARSWSQNIGTALLPGALVTGASGFNGLVFVVPEPGTMTLSGLGIAALLLLRLFQPKTSRHSIE